MEDKLYKSILEVSTTNNEVIPSESVTKMATSAHRLKLVKGSDSLVLLRPYKGRRWALREDKHFISSALEYSAGSLGPGKGSIPFYPLLLCATKPHKSGRASRILMSSVT